MNDSDSSRLAGSLPLRDEEMVESADQPVTRLVSQHHKNSKTTETSEPGSWLRRMFGRARKPSTLGEDIVGVMSGNPKAFDDLSTEVKTMLTSVLHLHEIRVEDLMVPRADIEAVDLDITLGELLKEFERTAHSRMPVYDDTLDDPRGMVHIRDIVAYITKTAQMSKSAAARYKSRKSANLDLTRIDLTKTLGSLELMRPVLFAPPSMMALDLMARMQANRIQMALVIDEYGGTDGLVSMEDVMEEIVGDIEDEHDSDDEELIVDKGNGVYVCSAKAELEDIEKATGVAFNAGDLAEEVDTIGGIVFGLTGRVPVRGEVINGLGFEFRILDADPRRVKTVELSTANRKRGKPPIN